MLRWKRKQNKTRKVGALAAVKEYEIKVFFSIKEMILPKLILAIKNIISFPFPFKWFWEKHVDFEQIVGGLQSTQNICRDGWIPVQIELE